MGERSIHLTTNQPVSSPSSRSNEESGWTKYFDDLLSEENVGPNASDDGFGISSSLVSDAASCAAWRQPECPASPALLPAVASEGCKKLNFKKRRTGGALDDDSLEDTASSPVNSPKVGAMQQKAMKPIKKDGALSSYQEKEVGSNNCEVQLHERNELGFSENDHLQLKQKGLCVVPLSMLVNYLQ